MRRLAFRILLTATAGLALCSASCQKTTDNWGVAYSGQGAVALRREEGPPMPPPPQPEVRVVERIVEVPAKAPEGPTPKEIELQRKIDAMEAQSRTMEDQSKAMKAELERLKAEKAASGSK
ncbi:MAG: hypothetical protein ACAI43_15490 [Phycisphaerae bacterium]|nr:hypothetical protein [Tepidisphaeraceae bacterium]